MRQLLPEYPPVTLAQMSEQMRQVFRKKALVAVFISRKRRYVKNIAQALRHPWQDNALPSTLPQR
jgi:hypothetical protein